MHTLLDLRGQIPRFISMTSGSVHEVNILDQLPLEAGSWLHDGSRLHRLCPDSTALPKAWRSLSPGPKDNMDFRVRKAGPSICPLACAPTRAFGSVASTPAGFTPTLLRRVSFTDIDTGKHLVFLEQQLHPGRLDHHPALSLSLANRIVLQVGQTASANQSLLWQFRQRGEDPSLDRHKYLRAHRHRAAQRTGCVAEYGRNGTDPEPDTSSRKPCFCRCLADA